MKIIDTWGEFPPFLCLMKKGMAIFMGRVGFSAMTPDVSALTFWVKIRWPPYDTMCLSLNYHALNSIISPSSFFNEKSVEVL